MVLLVAAGLCGGPTVVMQRRLSRRGVRLLAAGSGVLLCAAAACAVSAHPGDMPSWVLAPASVLAAVGAGSALTLGVLGLTAVVTVQRTGSAGEADPEPHAGSLARDGAAPSTSSDDEPGAADPGSRLLRGGTLIGVFERVAVTVTLLVGWPEGLAVLLALKGLGRFPELRAAAEHEGASERFILGTLVSALTAAACAGVVGLVSA